MTLTRWERQWSLAIWDAIYPVGVDPRLPMGIRELDTDGFLDDLERNMPGRWLWTFRLVVVLVALAPVLVLGRVATVAGLDLDSRVALLERMSASRVYVVRQLGALMKLTGALLYCAAVPVRVALTHAVPAVWPSQSTRTSRASTSLVPAARLVRHGLPVAV